MKEIIEEIKEITEENDLYGTYEKANAIAEFITMEENQEVIDANNLIAIYGKWGCGKSCIMKTISNKLDNEKYETIWFDTWKYEKDENLPYSLFKYIGKDRFWEKLKANGGVLLSYAYGVFKSICKGVELNIGIPDEFGLTINAGEMLDQAENEDKNINDKIESEKCLWEKINDFESEFGKIEFNGKKLVVFLDDLDRCESENIISLISSIKLLLSINKNIVFVVGIDKEAVTLALKNKYNNDYNKADEYLEKIFPINFCISNNIQQDNFKSMLKEILDIGDEQIEYIIDFFDKIHLNNPRHVKKVLRKYILVKDYLKSKIEDITDITTLILVLYLIILSMFYYDEYQHVLIKDKDKYFRNIILTGYDRSGSIKEYNYESFPKKECYINYDDGKIFEVYNLIMRLSSYRFNSNTMKCSVSIDGSVDIDFNNCKNLFKNNICNDFIDFLVSKPDLLEKISIDNKVDDNKLFDLIKEVEVII